MADNNLSLSTDIYGVNDYVNEIKKEFITGVSEDTLMLGIFGYLGQVQSDTLQNTIVMASEFSNESIPTKAKFEKNIIAHALGLTISDINAIPAKMNAYLVFYEKDIIDWANAITADGVEKPWTFYFDKDNKIMFGDYEFHTDYDIMIKKVQVTTKGDDVKFSYTAQYKQSDFDTGNPVSDITNPYLPPPVIMNLPDEVNSNRKFIFVQTTLRQVVKYEENVKVLSDDDISNKTITFTFEGQLAGFALDVTEGTETYHMVPVYEGLNVDTGGQLYFWYTYLDANTIRIKFDKNSRIPRINADVSIKYQITEGSDGNFTYVKKEGEGYPTSIIRSDKYSYANIYIQTHPIDTGALYGADKKTIKELKQMIPKEALARGSVTNTKDLENFFNATNSDYSKLYFYKKRDNCLERLYYAYIIMKNDNNIIPTNTLNVRIDPDELDTESGSGKYILRQGTKLILPPRTVEDPEPEAYVYRLYDGTPLPTDDDTLYDGSFVYYLPYDFILSKSPLYGMYFLNTIHANKILNFQYINDKCLYQYIATDLGITRNCLEDHNTYTVSLNFEQNVSANTSDSKVPIHYDEETGEYVSGVEVYMVIYDEDKNPLRYAKANFDAYEPGTSTASYSFTFTTEDYIDIYNRIRIDTGLYDPGTETESYAHLANNVMARLFIVSEQDDEYGFGDSGLPDIVPNLEGKSLSNAYDIIGGFDWFYNYSNIVNSTITVEKDPETEKTVFHVTGVPVIKDGYFDTEAKAVQFFNELISRKSYIDNCILKLEDAFEMDFKFFNTYGPARWYTWNGIDSIEDCLDRVNINLVFNARLKPNYDSNIESEIKADIKAYIEDINTIDSIHIPNLITHITNKYRDSLVYFEFVSINGMDASYQHIYAMDVPDGIIVPDFINIDTYTDPDTGATGLPDITINFV